MSKVPLCQRRPVTLANDFADQILWDLFFNLKLSGDKVCCTNALLSLMEIMQCSKLDCHKVLYRNLFPIRLRRIGTRNFPRIFFLLFTLVTGPKKSLRLKPSTTRVYKPQIRALLTRLRRVGTRNSPRLSRSCNPSWYILHPTPS